MLNRKKRIITAAVCIAAFILCFFPVFIDYINDDPPLAYSIGTVSGPTWRVEENAVVGRITKGVNISQEFICTGKGFVSATFTGATYGKTNTCDFHIDLVDAETGEIIEEWLLDARDFEDNSEFTVSSADPFANMKLSGRALRFDFYSEDATEDNALTLYYCKLDRYKAGKLTINDTDINGDLLMTIRVLVGPDNYEKTRIWLSIYLYCFVLFFIYKIYKWHNNRLKQ